VAVEPVREQEHDAPALTLFQELQRQVEMIVDGRAAGCPSCRQKRELLWADWAEEELLEDVAHRQNFHPHVHVLVTDGGFLPDGTFRPLAGFDSQHIERLFCAEVLRVLLAKELVTETIVDNLLSWRHSGFSAHGAVRLEDRKGAVRLGRYMIRCPIVLKRLSWEADTGEVVCRGRPSRRGGSDVVHARWDVLEFLVRVIDHIPEPSQQTVRYWGYYANAARGKRRKAA